MIVDKGPIKPILKVKQKVWETLNVGSTVMLYSCQLLYISDLSTVHFNIKYTVSWQHPSVLLQCPHIFCYALSQFYINFCTDNPFQTYSNQEHYTLYLSVWRQHFQVCSKPIYLLLAGWSLAAGKLSPCHTHTNGGYDEKGFWRQNHFEGTAAIPMLPSATSLTKPQISHTLKHLEGRQQNNPGSSTTNFYGE